jgi:acyl-CoA reductase-like NAD-dependent aldehyde dehydrogenase
VRLHEGTVIFWPSFPNTLPPPPPSPSLHEDLPLVGLVAALSAGNAVLLKPSEVSSASEQLLASLIPRYLDPRGVGLVLGGVAETTALLTHRFDSIMYTGNTFVGKIVMAAAAKFLTPVILELGGKNPVIVDRTANIDAAAQRIMRGRCLNAGQTCIAPEVVYVEKGVEEALLASMVAAGKRMFGEDPRASPHMGRIVNKHHWSRVMGLVKGAGGQVVWGGGGDEGDLYIAPTIIKAPSPAAKIMREEVFGPVVCVQGVGSVDEAIAAVNQGEKPLSLYIFSTSASSIKRVLENTSSGGAMVNDTIVHFAALTLPFGGVGESGMGAYHGKAGFDALSHRKSVMHANSGLLNLVPRFLDPPYYQGQDKVTGALISWLPTYLVPQGWKEGLILGLSVAVVVLGLKVGGKV